MHNKLTLHINIRYNMFKGITMAQWDKLIARICNLSSDIRFEELEKVLTHYGYKMKVSGGGSSHYIFRKPGYDSICIPKHEPIKKVYVRMVKRVIEREERDHV